MKGNRIEHKGGENMVDVLIGIMIPQNETNEAVSITHVGHQPRAPS